MKKESKSKSDSPIDKYIKVVKLPLAPNDAWEAFQIKQVLVQNGKVIKESLVDKPDTKQMTLAKAELMLNPDEEVLDA